MKVLISTDSSCLINQEVFKKYDINVFPLNVIIDGEEYLDGVTINQEQLALAMRSKKIIKTSTPPLGEVIDYFEKLFAKGYDHIIHFTISSKLSSMYSLFDTVAKQNFEGKVTVIDSYSASAPMLAEVFHAYDELQKGTAIDEIVKIIDQRKIINLPFMFIPENLNSLKNGGRISPAIALIGNSIGIKPIIVLRDGGLEKTEMVRNVKRTILDKISQALEKYPTSEYDYTLLMFDAEERTIDYITETANQMLKDCTIMTGTFPINVSAHVGPGTIGLTVCPKINGKSVASFIG